MMKPDPDLLPSLGGPDGFVPSGFGSDARRARTCTRAGLSRSARSCKRSLRRASSGGVVAPWLSIQSGSAATTAAAPPAVISTHNPTAATTTRNLRRMTNPPLHSVRIPRFAVDRVQYTADGNRATRGAAAPTAELRSGEWVTEPAGWRPPRRQNPPASRIVLSGSMRASELFRPVRLPPQEQRELEPIRNSCATIRLCQMSLDGSLADLEAARDLLVACPLTDQIRDHALALGEGFERRLRSQCLLARAQEGLQFSDQPGDEVPWEPDLPVLHRSQRFLELRGIYAPGAVPSGARLEREDPFCFGGSIRQGKDLRRRAQPMDRSEAVRPVEPGES